MAARPRKILPIAFMIVWLVVWAAMMILVAVALVSVLREGDLAGVLFILIWFSVAAFGLYKGATTLRKLLAGDVVTWTSSRRREWNDGVPRPGAPPPPPDVEDQAGDRRID